MKDVFAQLDGFVAVVNALSTLNAADSNLTDGESGENTMIGIMAVSFEIMILSMTLHAQNVTVFEVSDSELHRVPVNHF